ncbi:MAG: right-handed parallel beta-helix repeat-containing protein [Proteobacteria bacterium]|nr:right-handed parallel beta-helix repeat-containing protein [Pseudomonadota bacterium]
MISVSRLLLAAFLSLTIAATFAPPALAQSYPPYLDIGTPTLTELYVDPQNGSDQSSGTSANAALKTLSAAWQTIPRDIELTTGVRINILPGTIPESGIPNYLESRYGTAAAPIVIQSVAGRSSVVLQGDLNIFDTRYLYLIGVTIRPNPAGDTFHCEQCRHILLRDNEFDGGARAAHETIKVNQSQYIYLERNVIHGADDNAIDFVAVQYGHIFSNTVHNSQDWCTYVKGGSAYLRVEANEFYNCGTGGFTAGQGTGFEFMTSPWVHYEAYDIKFINNLVHDTEGAAIGVNGGLNILLAFNTFYRVGSRSHGIEVVFGSRSCDGDPAACGARRALGGWGVAAVGEEVSIPNRNVTIANNILYNPSGFSSQYQHFAIQGPRSTSASTNVPSPAHTDTGLVIRGNIIWNGPVSLPLGIEGGEQGCADSNPTCSETQLRADNLINTIEPALIAAASGDFRIVPGSALSAVTAASIEPFPATGRPAPPLAPTGELANTVSADRSGIVRLEPGPPGAYALNSPLLSPTPTPTFTPTPGARIRLRIEDVDKRKLPRRRYAVRIATSTRGGTGVALSAEVARISNATTQPLTVRKRGATRFTLSGTLAGGTYQLTITASGNSGAQGTLVKTLRL